MEELDFTDRQILRELQKDAKLTTKELASRVNLSPTPTFERVKRLEREGYIQRYIALVDPKKAGRNLVVLCNISLKQHTKEYIRAFIKAMEETPEVTECLNTSGDYDFMIKLYARDMQQYQDFILNVLGGIDSIGSIHSIFVMGEEKNTHAIPIG